MAEEDDRNPEVDSTFIARFYVSPDKVYLPERYLNAIMRTSIFEKILTKYIFQYSSNEFSLYDFLANIKAEKKELDKFKKRMKLVQTNFTDETPLSMYKELSKELLKLIKEDLTKIKYDKFILKMEFFLAIHFENNFFEEQVNQKMNTNFYDNMYLQKGRTNFNYSVECLNTLLKFLKVFEKESLSTKIQSEFLNNNDLFCSEKIYYFYCDQFNKDKIRSGHIVEYLISQLSKKLELLKNSRVNNKQMENYILINLFVINKIIQDYSFYFYKKPELDTIFSSLLSFKSWPLPIGNFANEILENIINECSFQGISILNKIREKFYIDILDQDVIELKTIYFNGALAVYSKEWDKRRAQNIHVETPTCFDLIKFLERLVKRPKKNRCYNFNLRELIVRILITFVFNSKTEYDNDTLQKIYDNFYTEYEQYDNVEVEEQSRTEIKKNENNDKYKGAKTKKSLEMLLKIIDVGFDKTIDDFDKEINIVANKILKLSPKNTKPKKEDEYNSLLNNNYLLPITHLRNYLRPQYVDIKKIGNVSEEGNVDFFDAYKKNLKFVVDNYFKYFYDNPEDKLIADNLKEIRQKFYNNFKLNIVLVEEFGVFTDFVENIEKQNKEIPSKIKDDEFDKFWKLFVNSKEEVKIQYLLHIVPHYEKYSENPFRFIFEDDNIDTSNCLLSEYIASNDNIYKNLVFLPWASKCDETLYSFIPNCQINNENVMVFPSLDVVYSFLKKPLDYYLSDSKGILQLDLYKITVTVNKEDTVYTFWKNAKITTKQLAISKIVIKCVDSLGLEIKDKDNSKEIVLYPNYPLQFRLYNLFFKKDVPFNYNMTSNNGWLEGFLCDKYDPVETEKICSYNYFITSSSEGQYYEEFNVPQMDLETIFKNYKITDITIQCSKNAVEMVIDDAQKIKFDHLPQVVDFTINIQHLQENGKNKQIPVATFVTL